MHDAAQLRCHCLHSVADTQHRHAKFVHIVRRSGRIAIPDRFRTARQDHAPGSKPRQQLACAIERYDLAIDTSFAHTARNELCDLAAKINNQYAIVMRCHGNGE